MRQGRGLLVLLVFLLGTLGSLSASQDILQRVSDALSERVQTIVEQIDRGKGELFADVEVLWASLESSPGTLRSVITFQARLELERGDLSQRFEFVSAGSDTHIETALEHSIETATRIIRSRVALGPLYAGLPRIVGVQDGLLYLLLPESPAARIGGTYAIFEPGTYSELARIQVFELLGPDQDGEQQALADLLFGSRELEAAELLTPLGTPSQLSLGLSQSIGATSISLGYAPAGAPSLPSLRALMILDVGYSEGINTIEWLTDSESVRLSLEAQLFQRVESRRARAMDRGYFFELAAGLGYGIDLSELSSLVTSSVSLRIGRYLPDAPQLGLSIGYRRVYQVAAGSLEVNTLSLGGFVTFGL